VRGLKRSKGKVCAGARCGLKEKVVELVRARWRLACAGARDGLRGTRVCWCALWLEGEEWQNRYAAGACA